MLTIALTTDVSGGAKTVHRAQFVRDHTPWIMLEGTPNFRDRTLSFRYHAKLAAPRSIRYLIQIKQMRRMKQTLVRCNGTNRHPCTYVQASTSSTWFQRWRRLLNCTLQAPPSRFAQGPEVPIVRSVRFARLVPRSFVRPVAICRKL